MIASGIDARRHHGDADHALQRRIEGRAENDVGLFVDLLTDAAGRLVDLIKGEVVAAGDRDQQAARALHRHFVEQRIGDGGLGRENRPALARGLARAHHRLAHAAHDRAHIGEVEVDQPFLDHQIGDRGDARIEHLIGHREGVREGRLLGGDAEQILVRNDDQRVDAFLQFADAALGDALAALAFEVERLRHDADGKNAHFARDHRDHRRRARARAAAHAGGDEAHMRVGQMLADFIARLLGGGAADFRLSAGAEALRDLETHLNDAVRARGGESLRIGVGHEKIDAGQSRSDHVVDGVAAAAAHAANDDAGLQFP